MLKTVGFFLDLKSPFSYLAHTRLPQIAKDHGYAIEYCPLDITAAKLAAGNYGPSNLEVPAKLRVLTADLHRWAARYRVDLVFPKSLQCESWNIGVIYAIEKDAAAAYVTEAYRRIWGRGIDPSDQAQLGEVAQEMGWDSQDFLTYVHSSRGRSAFLKRCVAAHSLGIFGVPMFKIADEYWWGNDRLMFVEEHMAATRAA